MDPNLEGRLWDRHRRDIRGLREEQVIGRSLTELGFGLPVEELADAWNSFVHEGDSPHEATLTSIRLGRRLDHRVMCLAQGHGVIGPADVVCLMERIEQGPWSRPTPGSER